MIKIKPLTIVVTGGLGFIGSRFIKFVYENSNHNIINIDKQTYAASHRRIPLGIRQDEKRYRYLKTDICDDVIKHDSIHSAHYVVNFAAESHVDNSIADGKPFMETNVMGVYNLLEQFKDAPNLRRFVQISTDEVYGDMSNYRGDSYATESFPLKPSSYYSASKASADLLVQSAARTFGVPYLITRTCNNFGPGQDAEKFLPKITKCITEGSTVPVYGDGNQVREWMFVDENVEIIYGLMMIAPENNVYNIGTGWSYTNNEVVDMISKAVGKEVKYEYVEDRLGHDRRYALDSSKVQKRILKSHTPITLKKYISETFAV
jgi:dTDP-glucose 4,6-dehydratase|tara:strand:- start:3656 stop:4612 length:957 start_codon:yes stop_codon:yes gene_type:complete